MTSLPGQPVSSPAPKGRAQPSNLTQRIMTGAVGLPVVLIAAYLGGWWLVALVVPLACIGVLEFCMLGRNRGVEGSTLVGAPAAALVVIGIHLGIPLLWLGALVATVPAVFLLELLRNNHDARIKTIKSVLTLAALLYVALPAALLVATRNLPNGFTWLLLIFCVTWGTDSFAYIGGRLWGRTKLAPTISPKKTVEGAIVGVVGGIIPAVVLLLAANLFSPLTMILVAIGPLLAILGDLVESGLKRAFQVKDSHLSGLDILPGHGGVLDRVDGLILVTATTYLYLILTGLAAV
jgi:phosphatidate cytidylyltransferase